MHTMLNILVVVQSEGKLIKITFIIKKYCMSLKLVQLDVFYDVDRKFKLV